MQGKPQLRHDRQSFVFPGAHSAGQSVTAAASHGASPVPRTELVLQPLGVYTRARLDHIWRQDFASMRAGGGSAAHAPVAHCDAALYRITYPSCIPEQHGRSTVASGLLAVPLFDAGARPKSRRPPIHDGSASLAGHTNGVHGARGAYGGALPVVSFQHNAVFAETATPSEPDASPETRLALAAFASQGYVVIAADYFGKGASLEIDSFLVKASTQQALLDLYRAAVTVCPELGITPGDLFLSGWSFGGWATLAFLEKLDAVGVPVTAAAAAGAPADLFVLLNHWLHRPAPCPLTGEPDANAGAEPVANTDAGSAVQAAAELPGLLLLQLGAYTEYYGLSDLLPAAVQPEYLRLARALYRGQLAWVEVAPQLPAHLNDLLQPQFVAAAVRGSACVTGSGGDGDSAVPAVVSAFWRLVQENHAYRWRSMTPLRLYAGEPSGGETGNDALVPRDHVALPAVYQQLVAGAPATVVAAGDGVSPYQTFACSLADQLTWFDGFLATS
jgi:hypothetical protein